MVSKFIEFYRKIYRNKINKKRKKLLTNTNPTIITRNCTGGVILNELNLKFNTPTINLFIEHVDFLEYLSHLMEYSNGLLIEKENSGYDFPVGILKCEYGEVNIFFMHYHSFEEAKAKWL